MTAIQGPDDKVLYRLSITASGFIPAFEGAIRHEVQKLWPLPTWELSWVENKRRRMALIARGNRYTEPSQIGDIRDRVATAFYKANGWRYCDLWVSVAQVVDECQYSRDDFQRLRAEEGGKPDEGIDHRNEKP